MNILEIDEVEKTVSADPTDLETLLAGYVEPAKLESLNVPVNEPVNQSHDWYGNPLYYQSGKKQGQIKPPPKKPFYNQSVNVSVNPDSSTISGDIISGALFLTIINLVFPMLFSVVNNIVSKKKVAYEDLQIDEKALKQLESLSDKALKHIKIEANPVGVLIFTLIGLYALQFMTVKMIAETSKIKLSKNGL